MDAPLAAYPPLSPYIPHAVSIALRAVIAFQLSLHNLFDVFILSVHTNARWCTFTFIIVMAYMAVSLYCTTTHAGHRGLSACACGTVSLATRWDELVPPADAPQGGRRDITTSTVSHTNTLMSHRDDNRCALFDGSALCDCVMRFCSLLLSICFEVRARRSKARRGVDRGATCSRGRGRRPVSSTCLGAAPRGAQSNVIKYITRMQRQALTRPLKPSLSCTSHKQENDCPTNVAM